MNRQKGSGQSNELWFIAKNVRHVYTAVIVSFSIFCTIFSRSKVDKNAPKLCFFLRNSNQSVILVHINARHSVVFNNTILYYK